MGPDDMWDRDDPETTFHSDSPGLDFLGQYAPAEDISAELSAVSEGSNVGDAYARPNTDVSFTVTNPSGALSATAALGGRIGYIEVTDVSGSDEVRLGREIVEIASLASDKARAAQHEVTVELMGRRGQDRVGVRSTLERSAGLPSYETISARAAEVFAQLYRSYDD